MDYRVRRLFEAGVQRFLDTCGGGDAKRMLRSRTTLLLTVLAAAMLLPASIAFARSNHKLAGVVHRFSGAHYGNIVVFHLRGVNKCRVTGGQTRTGTRYAHLRIRVVKHAVRHRVLIVRHGGRRMSLQVGCTASANTISATPDGVPAPSGGWSVDYGDAFKEPICTSGTQTGCDNTFYPNRSAEDGCSDQPGFNADEMEQFNCSQVSVGAQGLNLTCNPASGLTTPSGHDPSNYLCGTVDAESDQPAGYRFFHWKPGQGQEWAIQTVVQFPSNSGEADPGFWSTGAPWTEEIDFFEGFGSEAGSGGSWSKSTAGNGWIGSADPTWIYNETDTQRQSIGGEGDFSADDHFDPSQRFHTYTTVFHPNNTVSEYIDGHIQKWGYVPSGEGGADYHAGGAVVGPVPVEVNQTLGLIISYALRDDATGDPDPNYTSGTRDFKVRSVSVYENAGAHGANAANTGLAPGTSISGS